MPLAFVVKGYGQGDVCWSVLLIARAFCGGLAVLTYHHTFSYRRYPKRERHFQRHIVLVVRLYVHAYIVVGGKKQILF